MFEFEVAPHQLTSLSRRVQATDISTSDLLPTDSFQLHLAQPLVSDEFETAVAQNPETEVNQVESDKAVTETDLNDPNLDLLEIAPLVEVNAPRSDSGADGMSMTKDVNQEIPYVVQSAQELTPDADPTFGLNHLSETRPQGAQNSDSESGATPRLDAISSSQGQIPPTHHDDTAKPYQASQPTKSQTAITPTPQQTTTDEQHRNPVSDVSLTEPSIKAPVSAAAQVFIAPSAPPAPKITATLLQLPGQSATTAPLEGSPIQKYRPAADIPLSPIAISTRPPQNHHQSPANQTTPNRLEWDTNSEQEIVRMEDRPLGRATESVPRQAVVMTGAPPNPQAFTPQADVRTIATQLGQHLSTKDTNTTVIRLDPEELGHVKMTLRTSESGLVMTIIAEKPETSDLMRRNINELADEFRSMGFDTMDFQFGGQQSSAQDTSQNNNGLEAIPIDDDGPTHAQVTRHLDGKLNIRL